MKLVLALALAASPLAFAQQSATLPAATAAPATAATPSPVATLSQELQATASRCDANLQKLKVEKWKTDTNARQQAQATANALRRNLESAVPDLRQKFEAAPGSLSANFRLYRNIDALYDTLSSLAESAGAFGPKEQYEPLAADVAALENLRHTMAERVDELTLNGDAELTRWRQQAAAASAAAAKTPSKIVVDDAKTKGKKK